MGPERREQSNYFQQLQKEKEGGGANGLPTSRKSKPKLSKTSLRELSGKHFIGILKNIYISFEIYIVLGGKTMHFVRE